MFCLLYGILGTAKTDADAPCIPVKVGLDTSTANGLAWSFLGEAPGQTFMARDTLISALRVWRVANEDTNLFGLHLYITETDSAGTPLPARIVLDGSTIYHPYGDGIHPTLFEWVFDPPFAFPRPDRYAFFVQQRPCIGNYVDILAAYGIDSYPDGHHWHTLRYSRCELRPDIVIPRSDADLVFQIDFCSSTTTSVSRKTWGMLKVIYR